MSFPMMADDPLLGLVLLGAFCIVVMSLSGTVLWRRRQEAIREGRCPCCGQPVDRD
ncbi:MAG: hypothetical protein PVI57_10010 [Gemmatimonadota bacterium]